MKLKQKRIELVVLNKILSDISTDTKESYDKIFNFGVHRNLGYFESEIKSIQEVQKDSPEFQEFQQKMQEVGAECADKDDQNNPKVEVVNGQQVFIITSRKEEANKKVLELQDEYKEVLEEKKKSIDQLNILLEEEIEVDYCPISFKYFPDKIDSAKFKYLKKLIKETDEELEALL